MISDFHAYEKELSLRFLVPLLRSRRIDLTGKRVLDVGCGYGGVLAGLAETYPLAYNLGIDLDAAMIAEGKSKCPDTVRLRTGDFSALDEGGFDAILMRDVLEHIVDVEGSLAKAANLLNPGGVLFASFGPFYSPFGGHQHNGSGFFANLPWLQMLPEAWFRRALRLEGNSYKSGPALAHDVETVLLTRLTIRGFKSMAAPAGLRIRYLARYLSRPDYRIKFGLPAVAFPPLPILDDLLCTGVEALLEKA